MDFPVVIKSPHSTVKLNFIELAEIVTDLRRGIQADMEKYRAMYDSYNRNDMNNAIMAQNIRKVYMAKMDSFVDVTMDNTATDDAKYKAVMRATAWKDCMREILDFLDSYAQSAILENTERLKLIK